MIQENEQGFYEFKDRDEQWYIDQYNRNRDKKDWVSTYKELTDKLQANIYKVR